MENMCFMLQNMATNFFSLPNLEGKKKPKYIKAKNQKRITKKVQNLKGSLKRKILYLVGQVIDTWLFGFCCTLPTLDILIISISKQTTYYHSAWPLSSLAFSIPVMHISQGHTYLDLIIINYYPNLDFKYPPFLPTPTAHLFQYSHSNF